jgi:lipopolysaccharide transport system permease protein
MAWSFITPLAMLSVYTLIFSQVFKARWGGLQQFGPLGFAANLFAGLIVFTFFSECVSRAPSLILINPNYVKKIIFPLEILVCVAVGAAAFHALVSFVILAPFVFLAFKQIPVTFLWMPIVWLPLLFGCLACSLLLSSAGVFLRDISQVIGVGLNMLMFLSPIFFPISALPDRWQPLLNINPLAHAIEQTRKVAINGLAPSPAYLIVGIITTIIACELSFRVFVKLKRGFADVL